MSEQAGKLRAAHWIRNEWLESSDMFDSFNPANGDLLGKATNGGAAEARAAIAAARESFDEGTWATSPRLRAATMLEFAQRLAADAAPLADLLTTENGKLRRECAGDTRRRHHPLRPAMHGGVAGTGAAQPV